MEPFVAVDDLGDLFVPVVGGIKRLGMKRFSVGIAWQMLNRGYSVSLGWTSHNSSFIPVYHA